MQIMLFNAYLDYIRKIRMLVEGFKGLKKKRREL
jgi:hypothetical protein